MLWKDSQTLGAKAEHQTAHKPRRVRRGTKRLINPEGMNLKRNKEPHVKKRTQSKDAKKIRQSEKVAPSGPHPPSPPLPTLREGGRFARRRHAGSVLAVFSVSSPSPNVGRGGWGVRARRCDFFRLAKILCVFASLRLCVNVFLFRRSRGFLGNLI